MKINNNTDLILFFVLGVCIGMFVGTICGMRVGNHKAIEAGVAYYSVNPTSGVTSFNFKTNVTNTVENNVEKP